MSSEVPNWKSIYDEVSQVMQTNYIGFVSFTILIWDHVDTFAEEVKYIWNGKKSPIVYLFLINRYLTPLGFIVNLFAYLSPVWTPIKCKHFIRYEGAMTMIGISIVALMMLLRIYALYYTKQWVVRCVALLLLVQIVVNGWLLTIGEPVSHTPGYGLHSCTMIFGTDKKLKALSSSSAWLPLLYDTVATSLTIYRTIPSIREKNTMYVTRRLLKDGLIYYAVILTVTLVLTFMICFTSTGIQNIVAQLELNITVTMMSRITLNLRKSVYEEKSRSNLDEVLPVNDTSTSVRPRNSVRVATPRYLPTVNDHRNVQSAHSHFGNDLK